MTSNNIDKAVNYFKSGYNCAQAVTAAFAEEYGFTEEQALRMSASFGGGIGRMRSTCGAACGMFILAGLETATIDGGDQQGKGNNYAVVQALAEEFKKRNGSLICAELLGLSNENNVQSQPEARTNEYYKKRPCVMMVESATQIFADFLKGEIDVKK